MISRRAAGLALAILGIGYAAVMIWLVGLFGPFEGPDQLVRLAVVTFSVTAVIVGVVQVAVLGSGPKPSGKGVSILAAGLICAVALVAVVVLVIAWSRGADTVLVGIFAVPVNTAILLAAARNTHRQMAEFRPRSGG